jgi:hypothetical protein
MHLQQKISPLSMKVQDFENIKNTWKIIWSQQRQKGRRYTTCKESFATSCEINLKSIISTLKNKGGEVVIGKKEMKEECMDFFVSILYHEASFSLETMIAHILKT